MERDTFIMAAEGDVCGMSTAKNFGGVGSKRLRQAKKTYNATHGADDYSDAVANAMMHYFEVDFTNGRKLVPAVWLGFKPSEGIIDVVFAQKNDGYMLPPGQFKAFVKKVDKLLQDKARRFSCNAIRFAGRYGWQRYARELGYCHNGDRSPRGYPYFTKVLNG